MQICLLSYATGGSGATTLLFSVHITRQVDRPISALKKSRSVDWSIEFESVVRVLTV